MALTILDRPSTGGQLGSAFGTGLKALAQSKLDAMAKRQRQSQTQKGLEAIVPGLKPEQYGAISGLDPQILQQFVKGELARPGEEAYAKSINQILGGEQGVELPNNARLNAQQATNLANISFKQQEAREKHESARQKNIDATNKTWNTQFDKSLDIANKIHDISSQMKDLLSTGKVNSGIAGRYTPEFLQNDESRQFEALSNEIASLIAANSGVATNFKIKLAQSMKPNLTQPRKTQEKLLGNIIDQSGKIRTKGDIRNELIAENKGNQPANLGSLVEKKYKEGKSVGKENNQGFIENINEVIQELSKNNAPIGTEVEDDEGNILYWNGQELTQEKP